MSKKISEAVLNVLAQADCRENTLTLTGTLDRKLYVDTNKVLESIGGKWNKKLKTHVFDADLNVKDMIEETIAAGEYIDPRQEYGFFETPKNVVVEIITLAEEASAKFENVLEPSAGKGRLIEPILERAKSIVAVELQEKNAQYLKEKFPTIDVYHQDFLTFKHKSKFDTIVMNPPFSKLADVAHVKKASEFLAPGGVLVSIMSPSWTFRSNTQWFVDWVDGYDHLWEMLPGNSFSESGTNVRTGILMLKSKN